MQELWDRCLSRLESELPSQQFNMWIRPLQAVPVDGTALTLYAPNRFVVDWVRDKYLERLNELVVELTDGEAPTLHLEVGTSRSVTSHLTGEAAPAASERARPAAPAPEPPKVEQPAPARHRSNLIGGYTFETFVEGKANRMAFAAAQQVAENPGSQGYNPLLLYGGNFNSIYTKLSI